MNSTGPESTRVREHLANERTLLAWVRTAITFLALGFVVARFGLFLKQIALETHAPPPSETALSGFIGIVLVVFGTLPTILSAVRFLRARAQIDRGAFQPAIYPQFFLLPPTLLPSLPPRVYLPPTAVTPP